MDLPSVTSVLDKGLDAMTAAEFLSSASCDELHSVYVPAALAFVCVKNITEEKINCGIFQRDFYYLFTFSTSELSQDVSCFTLDKS